MATTMAGLRFWELTFDADGDTDAGARDQFLTEVRDAGITDLVVFSHGWNNDHRIANSLYERFFGLLADQLPAARRDSVGLVGVFWPSQRWSDEPIPDFAAAVPRETAVAGEPALDKETLAQLQELVPAAADQLAEMAQLLGSPPTDAALTRFHDLLAEFSTRAGAGGDDGEGSGPVLPPMLTDDARTLFERYRDTLRSLGVTFQDGGAGGAGGAAGAGVIVRSIEPVDSSSPSVPLYVPTRWCAPSVSFGDETARIYLSQIVEESR